MFNRGQRRRSAFAVMGLVAALTLSACGSSDDSEDSGESSDEPITIGFVVGKTGILESYDVPAMTMAQLAIDAINAEGGIDGRQIETVEADMKSKPELAGTAATKVIDEGADVLLVPCDFDFGSPAALVAQEEGKVAISLCAASTNFGPAGIGNLAYTMGLAGVTEGTAAAEWAYEDQGWTSAYVLLDDTLDQNKQGVGAFKSAWERVGGELVGEDTFKQEDQSIDAQVSRISQLSEQPDFLYVSSFQPGFASALKQIRDAGIDSPIVGGSDLDGDYWKEGVPSADLNDIYFTAMASIYGDDPNGEVNDLLDQYEAEVGAPPDVSAFLGGYSAVEAVEAAVAEAGSTDGEAMAAVMDGFTDEDFILETTYTPEQHISLDRKVRIMQIENGDTSFVMEWKPTEVALPGE